MSSRILHGKIILPRTKILDNAKKCADENPGYKVFDVDGKVVYEAKAEEPVVAVPFKVRVSIPDLNIRSGPGIGYQRKGFIPVGVYTIVKVENGNESYEAVTFTPEGSNIGVNIGIDKFYDAMENGRSYDEVVDKAVEVVNSGITQRPDFDIDSLSDYSQMKEKGYTEQSLFLCPISGYQAVRAS